MIREVSCLENILGMTAPLLTRGCDPKPLSCSSLWTWAGLKAARLPRGGAEACSEGWAARFGGALAGSGQRGGSLQWGAVGQQGKVCKETWTSMSACSSWMESVKRAKDPVTRTVSYKCMDLDLRNHRRKFRCCLEAPLVVCSVVSHVWGLGREVWWDLISSKSVNYNFQIRASVQKHRFLIWIKKPFISTKHSRHGWSRRALKYIRSSWCVSCAVPKRLMRYCSRRFITTTCLRSCNSLPKATRVCKLTCWVVVQFCRVQEVSNVEVTLCMNKFRLLENRWAVDLRAGDAENPPGVPWTQGR